MPVTRSKITIDLFIKALWENNVSLADIATALDHMSKFNENLICPGRGRWQSVTVHRMTKVLGLKSRQREKDNG